MKSISILHEGNEKKAYDNKLIRLLMGHLKLDIDLVSFLGMGSKSNFFKQESYTLLSQAVQTNQIEKILFVIDADDAKNDAVYGGFNNTQNALNSIISTLNFQAVSRIYIMCDPMTKAGYLESFILSTIPEAQKNCIESFLNCSQFKSKENHKAILNDIYTIAYPNTPYDFKHPHFDSLKAELTQLFN